MDFTKFLIGGGLAYGIYWWMTQPATASTVTQGMAANPLSPVILTGVTPASNNSMLSVLSAYSPGYLEQIAGVAVGTPLSFSQWNYFLTKTTGITGPEPDLFGISDSNLITASTYYPIVMGWAAKQAGLSALSGLSGLGVYVRENEHNG